MKKILLLVVCVLFVFTQGLGAQSAFVKKKISSGTGFDESPRIVRIGADKFAVTWLRAANANESRLAGRAVTTAGAFASGIKSNILGATIYRYSNYDVAALSAGGFVLTGTRNTDRQIISRFFNGAFGAIGAAHTSGVFGYNPAIVPTSAGFLLGQGDGDRQSSYTRLDTQAHKLGEPVSLKASNASNGFNLSRIRQLPSGDFLILGYEKNAAGNSRAAAYNTPASLSSVSSLIPYETAFGSGDLGIDASVDAPGGLSLFGHVVSDSKTAGKLRALNTTGRPSGGSKPYPTGKTNVFARNFRITSLTGTGTFVASWEEPGAGLIYLRLYNLQGVPIASTTTLVPEAYKYPGGIGDVAWDPTTRTLIAVWTQYGATTGKTEVWLGLYRIGS